MELKLSQHINRLLKKAHYEYDPSVKEWAGWIRGLKGVYAQGKNIEEVRTELISTLEDFLLLNLRDGLKIPGLVLSPRHYARTH